MFAVLAFDEGRAPAAGVVAGALALDLDDVGAEIGEDLAGPGAGQDAGEFEDAQARQRLRHVWKAPKERGMDDDAGGYKTIASRWPDRELSIGRMGLPPSYSIHLWRYDAAAANVE